MVSVVREYAVCAHCKEKIGDKAYVYHSRLKAAIHADCPMDNIFGEDIRLHTMYLHNAVSDRNDTIEERGEVD